MNNEKPNKKADKRKKQWILLGVVVAVFAVLIGGVFLLGKSGMFHKEAKESADDQTAVPEEPATVEENAAMELSLTEGAIAVEEVLTQASDYDAIYNRLADFYENLYAGENLYYMEQDSSAEEGELEAYEEEHYDTSRVITFTQKPDYEGVGGDIYERDDNYAYLVRNDSAVCIMELNGSTMEQKGVISEYVHGMESVWEIHVQEDRLVLITSYTEMQDEETGLLQNGIMIYTYDITDRTSPALMGSVEMEGFYLGSRVKDGVVYAYTNCYKGDVTDQNGNVVAIESLDPTAYVPSVNGAVLPAESVYMANTISDTSYVTCVSVDLDTPDEIRDAKAFLSVTIQYYAGENGFYLTMQNGLYNVKNTALIRFDFEDGMMIPAAAAVVDGYILETASLSEKDGILRVVSSIEKEGTFHNSLYVLDEQMGISTKKENLADGELVQSVCFIEDNVYLSAYGENPIEVVELTDMDSIGEPMPAYSEGFEGRLYAYGENQILALSYALDAETGEYSGLRLTMFDTTNPAEMKAVHTLVIEADNSSGISDINKLFVDSEKGLIGFPTEDWDESYTTVESKYRLYGYSAETGFQSQLEANLTAGSGWYVNGFCNGDTFYVLEQDTSSIRSFDITNGYAQTGELYY